MISIAGSTCDVCYDVLVQFIPFTRWLFSREAHLAITFDTIFRFVAPGGSGSYYELQHDGIYTVSIVLYLEQYPLEYFPRSGIGMKGVEAVAPRWRLNRPIFR